MKRQKSTDGNFSEPESTGEQGFTDVDPPDPKSLMVVVEKGPKVDGKIGGVKLCYNSCELGECHNSQSDFLLLSENVGYDEQVILNSISDLDYLDSNTSIVGNYI